ncbi:MAG: helix-turn-helix domain-containing protein [Firmicutes bacterium]|nr:helix-turn-helix domain-containing protein [Bacillota bacterium]
MLIFRERLKAIREKNNLTQKQLAKALGIKTSEIEMYESGKREPRIFRLIQLCDYFGVTTDYLAGTKKSLDQN